jgi:flavin reductase (DIM6/NTAB) family NADH-FMN oxidoreductase RutF
MKKISISENAYPYPMPMVVLGTLVEDRPNFMAVGWVARVNFQPPMIAVALGKGHYTNGGSMHPGRSASTSPASTSWQGSTIAGSSRGGM